MKFSLELPVGGDAPQSFMSTELAQAAERAGFALLGYTDHPAPSAKWLGAGGHPTFDPFAALAFVAAVTSEIRLMTHLVVLGYRNPMLLAKSIATVDCLSDGRFTLVAGTGYLRSEFAALGRPFDERNDLFDETMHVLRSVFVDEAFVYEGRDFAAHGVKHDPPPVQLPHPPIWIGGSSRASRQRVARFGTGWSPLYVNEMAARTVRTAPLATDDDLVRALADLRELLEAEGRDPAGVSVQLDGIATMSGPADAMVARAAELEVLGVTHLVVRPPAGPVALAAEAIERFGSDVIATMPG